ncbi:ATP-binding cassette sub-family A member 3 [Eumeta japonica]|uniref:ATP-binding cassette sub-family A member 3 n=1 Tax=Eumeta variegata TaxID=151549 RepID=A0A4C1WT81_EUMVA|nr:ATP-binding cassette sub-family A member 3 [Eumeta japonica]
MATTTAKEATAFTKLKLLTWKNFLQQWRHRGQTSAEVGLPVLTMSLILILRWQISPQYRDTFLYPPMPASTLEHSTGLLANMRLTNLTFAYSPRSPVLEDVVRSSLVNLISDNAQELLPMLVETIPGLVDLLPPGSWNQTLAEDMLLSSIRVQAYDDSGQLTGLYVEEETTRVVLAAVQFDDSLYDCECGHDWMAGRAVRCGVVTMSQLFYGCATQLPRDISYSLRFPERPRTFQFLQQGGRSWRSDLLFPVFDTPGPRAANSPQGGNDPGYVNEMFIALQHSISMELISRLADVDLSGYQVNIQRFPYPSYLEDYAVEALQYLFPSFLMMSFCYTAVNIAKAVTLEKEMQLKESMKIMGLPTWLHWTAWFFKQFLFLMIVTVLIVLLLKIPWFTTEDGISGYSVFTNTPWSVLIFFIGLYAACTIFFCFMMSGFFSKASTASLFTGLLWFVTYMPSFLLTLDVNYSPAVQALTCLAINSGMSYGFGLLLAAESSGGMQWGHFMDAPSTDVQFVFGHVVIMLAVNCVIYMLIALYLEQVLPGAYGVAHPWYFPVQRSFWFPDKSRSSNVIVPESNASEVVKENDPTQNPVGVQISKLTKVFGKNLAVNELSLNVYEGQITVLLGHNGAGKSTTISMLTGNIEPTYGTTVILGGYNLSTQLKAARTQLGLCPQHNVIFDDLTVEEHIEFFSRLKGYSGPQLEAEIDLLIEKLELQDKRKYQAGGLSGGQKRRLAVGVALSGGTRVVLLDEPTSGMDPSSRRALWELLQREKKDRSIILTTHFMDEADVLGDRVAIMAHGRLQCVGSPYFLKRHYGVGYTLVVVKGESFDERECTELIRKYITNVHVKEDRGSEVTYNLPSEYSHCFVNLLTDLEAKIHNIGFKNYGLTATTLEDVFMSGDKAGRRVTGFRLLWQQVVAVWLKLFLVWTRSPWLVAMQILVPLLMMILTLSVLNVITTLNDSIFRRELTLNEGFSRTETLLSYEGVVGELAARAARAYAAPFAEADPDSTALQWVHSQTPGDYYLEKGQDVSVIATMRHTNLIGASFNDSAAVAWFSNFGYHDVAISVAGVHAALLRALVPDASLVVYNHPLEATYEDQSRSGIRIVAMTASSADIEDVDVQRTSARVESRAIANTKYRRSPYTSIVVIRLLKLPIRKAQ